MSGCVTVKNDSAIANPKDTVTITVIDTERFDQQLTTLIRDGYIEIQVAFFHSESINDIPPRLQNWLTHIDEFGQGYEISKASSEYVTKNPGLHWLCYFEPPRSSNMIIVVKTKAASMKQNSSALYDKSLGELG